MVHVDAAHSLLAGPVVVPQACASGVKDADAPER